MYTLYYKCTVELVDQLIWYAGFTVYRTTHPIYLFVVDAMSRGCVNSPSHSDRVCRYCKHALSANLTLLDGKLLYGTNGKVKSTPVERFNHQKRSQLPTTVSKCPRKVNNLWHLRSRKNWTMVSATRSVSTRRTRVTNELIVLWHSP